jgi:hypothetical protein
MAGMIVEGGGGEPPPFSETQARLREVIDDPAVTVEERNKAQLVYKAEMEAARRIWEAKAGEAFFDKYKRPPDSEAEALEGEELAGVPYEYEGVLSEGYLKNRRRCKRRRRALANRVEKAALSRLANIGWTEEARAASLLVRRLRATAPVAAAGPRNAVAGLPGVAGVPLASAPGPSSIRAPTPSPQSEGKYVNVDGWISIIQNGIPLRLGSAKVLCVFPDGQLGLKYGGRAYAFLKPWETTSAIGRPRFLTKDGKLCVSVGNCYIDLSTGRRYGNITLPSPKGGGTVKTEIDPYGIYMGSGCGFELPPDLPETPDESRRRYLRA